MVLANIYRNKRILVTGHNGFKGSWLCLWLETLGADVMGVSLPPMEGPGHAKSLRLAHASTAFDVRDAERLQRLFHSFQPDIVFHLAAQPLVGPSLISPHHTFDVNIRGTLNVLESARSTPSMRAVVCVTSDKVYAEPSAAGDLRESARLGGDSPYAASKAASELVLGSYQRNYFSSSDGPLLGIARAGNIVGGGDWGEQRLIPDMIRAVFEGTPLTVRHPTYQRSWLHVFDVVHGYLVLGAALAQRNPQASAAFNFGPGPQGHKTVSEVLQTAKALLPQLQFVTAPAEAYPEEKAIALDVLRAKDVLGWQSALTFAEAMELTIDWYRQYYEARRVVSRDMLAAYIKRILPL